MPKCVAAIDQTAAAYPDIVRVSTVGHSLEGRNILAVKISDEPDTDDPAEPAVLFMSLHHAREHLTVEMALEIIRLFTEGYGQRPRTDKPGKHARDLGPAEHQP